MENILKISDLQFGWQKSSVPFLRVSGFEVKPGEKVFLRGNSGSGKSTLLNLIAGIFLPSRGEIRICDHCLSAMTTAERDRFRANYIGVIFQQFNLLPYLSVLENVLITQKFSSKPREIFTVKKATSLLNALDIPTKMFCVQVNKLSIGQQQRVAIARSLIGKPELILADEPTSALDKDNKNRFLDLLFSEAKKQGSALIFASHDETIESCFDQIFRIPEFLGENIK